MSRTPTAHGMSAAVQELHLTLATAAERHRPPCRGRHEWTSDDADDRAAAVEACGHCPHQDPCGAYARAAGEQHGVWAGRDRTASASIDRRRTVARKSTGHPEGVGASRSRTPRAPGDRRGGVHSPPEQGVGVAHAREGQVVSRG